MKKYILLITLFSLVLPALAMAQTQTMSVMGSPYSTTVSITVGDASALLTTLLDVALSSPGYTAVKAFQISCEGNDARIAFGVAAENDGTPVGHIIAVGEKPRWPSRAMLEAARVINKTAGSAATLMVTLEY